LSWPAVESILQNRPVKPKIDELTNEGRHQDTASCRWKTAQRTLRFWQVHNKLEK